MYILLLTYLLVELDNLIECWTSTCRWKKYCILTYSRNWISCERIRIDIHQIANRDISQIRSSCVSINNRTRSGKYICISARFRSRNFSRVPPFASDRTSMAPRRRITFIQIWTLS